MQTVRSPSLFVIALACIIWECSAGDDDVEPDQIIFGGMENMVDAFCSTNTCSDDAKKKFAAQKEKLEDTFKKKKMEKVSTDRAKRFGDGFKDAGEAIKDGGDAVKTALASGSAKDITEAVISITNSVMTTISAFSEAAGPWGAALSGVLSVVQFVMNILAPPPYGSTKTSLTDVVSRVIQHALNEQSFLDTKFDFAGYFNQFDSCFSAIDQSNATTAKEMRDVLDVSGLTQILVDQDQFLGNLDAKIKDAIDKHDPAHIIALVQMYWQTSTHLSLLIARGTGLITQVLTDPSDDLTGLLSAYKVRGSTLLTSLKSRVEGYVTGNAGMRDMQQYLFVSPADGSQPRTTLRLYNVKYSAGLATTCDKGCGGTGPHYPYATLKTDAVPIQILFAEKSKYQASPLVPVKSGDLISIVNKNTDYYGEYMMMYYSHWNWYFMYDDLRAIDDNLGDEYKFIIESMEAEPAGKPLRDNAIVHIKPFEYPSEHFSFEDDDGNVEYFGDGVCSSKAWYAKYTQNDDSDDAKWRLVVAPDAELSSAADDMENHLEHLKDYPPTPAPSPSLLPSPPSTLNEIVV